MNVHDQETLAKIAQNWRLTPATMATKITNGQWIAAPWLRYAATKIAMAIQKGGGRIIISAPPRHGKSELVSIHTPIWVLENFPRKNVILTGYGAELVEIAGRRVRDTIRDNEGLLRARIRPDVSKVSAFLTETDGYMFSVGLGGAITGRGAHVLLIDDYIKEIKEALSQAHRDYIWNWFVTTAMTRLEPGATVIIIATRWHSDDLIGRILKHFPDKWENICLPAFAGENDLIGRKPGEVLFPERYDVKEIEDQRDLLGGVFFHALYQQGPVDEILQFTNKEWIGVCKELPADDFRWARVWDLAATEDGGDYTCGTLCGYSKSTGKFVIANVLRKQKSIGDVEKLVRNTAAIDGVDVEVLIEQEPGSAGKALIHHYSETVLPEFKVNAVPTTKAKLVRAQPMLAAAEAGKVYLLDESAMNYDQELNQENVGGYGTWHQPFLNEFDSFPGGENDDQIDTASAGYSYLSGKKKLSVSWGRRAEETEKKSTAARLSNRKTRQAQFLVKSPARKLVATFGRK